jgi:cephalosporin hydroxylase
MNTLNSVFIDIQRGLVTAETSAGKIEAPLDSAEAFELISKAWLRCGWDTKYVYSFSWLGRPIIQLPEDLVRMQEVIFAIKPDVILETGVAHGGSLVFYASLCKAMGKGRVIGIDIEVRPHNRAAIESHFLGSYITLIEGSSTSPQIIADARSHIKSGETVLVCLDSCHTKEHVLAELNAYARFVSVGSYIVAMDGIMQEVVGAPRTHADWTWNNPREAVFEFLQAHPEFELVEPPIAFNEGKITNRVTYWPDAFLRRRK